MLCLSALGSACVSASCSALCHRPALQAPAGVSGETAARDAEPVTPRVVGMEAANGAYLSRRTQGSAQPKGSYHLRSMHPCMHACVIACNNTILGPPSLHMQRCPVANAGGARTSLMSTKHAISCPGVLAATVRTSAPSGGPTTGAERILRPDRVCAVQNIGHAHLKAQQCWHQSLQPYL